MFVPHPADSNFHSHRRENAIAKKAQFAARDAAKGGGGGGGGGGRGGGNRDLASDSAAFGRFKSNERNMGRR